MIKSMCASTALFVGLASIGMSPTLAATCTVPNAIANGQVADASKVMGDFNAVANCAQAAVTTTGTPTTGSLSVMSGASTITGGNLSGDVTTSGSTVATMANSGVAAGSYVTANITVDAKGRVTSAANGSSGATTLQREFGPFSPPTASTFTFIDTIGGITPTVTNVTDVGMVYSVPITTDPNSLPGAYIPVPVAATWTLTLRAKFTVIGQNYLQFGLWIKDSAGKMIGETVQYNGGQFLTIQRNSSNTAYSSLPYQHTLWEAPTWFRVAYDGTNLKFYASWDGQNWLYTYTETKTAFLNGTLQYVGVGGSTDVPDTAFGLPGSKTGAVITYWNIQ